MMRPSPILSGNGSVASDGCDACAREEKGFVDQFNRQGDGVR